MNNKVYDKLAEVRKKKGLSFEEIAARCKVSGQTVRNIENGTSINPIVLSYYLSIAGETDRENILDLITERV